MHLSLLVQPKSSLWQVRLVRGKRTPVDAAQAGGPWGGPCIPSTYRCQNAYNRFKLSAQYGLKHCLWLLAEQISDCRSAGWRVLFGRVNP